MTVIETMLATEFSEPPRAPVLVVRLVTKFLKLVLRPRANPDFEDAYYKVVKMVGPG